MNKTKRGPARPRKASRRRLPPASRPRVQHHIAETFLHILNLVKLYHWNTHLYPEHKATDELYSHLNEHVDKFVEVMLGKAGGRIPEAVVPVTSSLSGSTDLRKKMDEFKSWLSDMNKVWDPVQDSDLLNIRDEILADVNQFTYLLTFH